MWRRALPAWLPAVALLLAAGCGGGEESRAEDREEIETFLRGYLPRLAAAYGEEDPSRLDGGAAPKEEAKVADRIRELAMQGQTLVPEFRQMTVERLDVTWNGVNASVTTVETWALTLLARGTDRVVSETGERTFRVTYHLRRGDDGAWRVLYRTVQE